MTAPLLDIDNVTKKLGDKQFGFSLAIAEPGIVAVLGPSGSGKTTLFNLIAGFETPDSGTVRIDGRDMSGVYPGKRPISIIFQDNNLFGHLTVSDNVGLGLHPGLRLSADDRASIERALTDVGLSGFGGRMPATLSGGERQRVAFARALVRNRPLLLLDEPFAALDQQLRGEMGDLLVALQHRTNCLVLMVTHDEAEASRLASRVIRIDGGRIVGQTGV